ncbi:S-layer protein [Paenibacillus sp. 1011MAR3C5]|uniref:S-layer homology domain-containing protein n=1 Tax=Paenibacillus sp. 1011MAR3C5 TaxID=1675787 RepID=UPI000E6BD968|nr:S-layer homology domain-containing protein [Paenibacillus sp. 1011MAR3C5]RJE88745.1 S-layer protein [Paenibacillus sp. 1011MAR3C5]
MRKYGKNFITFLIVCLFASVFSNGVTMAQAEGEAASVDDSVYAVAADGSTKLELNYINTNVDSPQRQDYLALFTSGTSVTNVAGNNNEVFVKSTNVAIQVDANGSILKWIGPQGGLDPVTNKPIAWDAAQQVTIPPGGYVILANDNNWLDKDFRKALYTTFHAEDAITLEKGGAIVTAEDFIPKEESGDLIEIEAPPADVTVIVEGPKKPIDYIDTDVSSIPNIIALFTNEYGSKVSVRNTNVAIQVDATGKVTTMFNAATGNSAPSWSQGGDLDIPPGGYVVMAQDNSYATYDIKKYLATKFKVGDMVKLRKNGNVVAVKDLMKGTGALPRMELDGMNMYTTPEATATVSGKVTNQTGASVAIGEQSAVLQTDGTFSMQIPLAAGPNYLDVVLSKDGSALDTKSIIVYSRPSLNDDKQIMLWVDQASNAKKLQSSESVLQFLTKAKDAGVTDVMFDVKGVEGYVSYKKNDLTGRPYVSEMVAGDRKGSNPDLDLLQLFLEHGHALGMKVHAAFNVFAEGSIAVKDFAIIHEHPEWEEHVFRPEDNGQILALRESEYGKKGLSDASGGAAVLFVNPANDDTRQFQLKTFEEVLKNYDVDGIVLDRARYDNETADFSDVTKAKFEAFLAQRGKSLGSWPNDIFYYENGNRVNGPLIQDWWEFRSATITSFVEETRALVDRYSAEKEKKIETSAYVGAWFESYYLNGVHWGSKDFRYDDRLKFPNDTIYTEEYYNTGYISHLDFLMVGTYYSTTQEIQRYVTLDSIVTNGEVPLYSGMALSNLQSPALQREIFQTALGSSDGLMLFDASLANWPIIKASIQDKEYVKDYQLGMSVPGDSSSFIEGSFYNTSRNLGDLNVMDEEFGTSTGTNKFGVEVVVDDSGKVTKVVNKKQAIDWNWGVPEDNNSAITPGGMVISALDENGVRTKRQLVASTYDVGDNVRAAALTGYMDYDGKTVSSANATLKGNIKVLGPGSKVDVFLNDKKATVASGGDFTGIVNLKQGANTVTISVYVDELKTNELSIQMTYTPSVTPPDGGSGGGVTEPEPNMTNTGVVMTADEVQTTDENGNPAAAVTLNPDMINTAIAALQKDGKNKKEMILDFSGDQPVSIVNVPVQALLQAADSIKDAILTIKTGGTAYRLPANLIDAATLSALLGNQASNAQAIITVEKKSGADAKGITDAIEAQGGLLIGDAYDFRITLKAGDRSVSFSDFGNRYVERSFTLPSNLISQATAVAIDPTTGELSFIPARFTTVDGATVVTIKHAGNSVYAVISYSKSFQDLENHWARADIEWLASKLLVKGMSESLFAPDASITRAEFVALLIRALGLKELDGSPFSDVQTSNWFAGYAATAAKTGLIEGYEDGTFRPSQTISREEMAVLALRAANFVEKQGDSTSLSALEAFSDGGAISNWARNAAAFALDEGLMNGVTSTSFAPQEQATRAQAVVILKRLLIKLSLIDKESH